MKRRRTLIISLLLIAALALGIGYAALSTDLTITGTVTNTPHPIEVVFESGAIVADESLSSAVGTSSLLLTPGTKTATFDVDGLVHAGDKVVAKFVVVNNNRYAVKLDAPVITETDNNNLFTATAVWVDDQGTPISGNVIDRLDAGEKATFKLTIKMDKDTAENYTGTYALSVTATSIE